MHDGGAGGQSSGEILVLTEMDARSASTRYRALQHLPRLKQSFGTVRTLLPNDDVARLHGRAGQVRYFASHSRRYLQRTGTVARALRGADAVFIQRGLYPLGPGVVVEPIRRYKGRVVYDLDDAVFHTKPALANRGTFARWLYGAQQARQLLQRADAVVVSSVELADALPSYVAAPIVLPTVPDPQRYLVAEPQNESELPLRVGWAGTVGNIAYLESLRGVFERLAREGIARLEVVSSEPWDGPAAFHRWELEEEAQLFARFSVGIMPLPDTPYTRAKAGFKLLQYMAAGLPVVASPIGVNRELIQRSGGGFLASSGDEWLEALEALARSADLRHEMGRRGRAFVESYADLDAQAGTLTKLLRGRS